MDKLTTATKWANEHGFGSVPVQQFLPAYDKVMDFIHSSDNLTLTILGIAITTKDY